MDSPERQADKRRADMIATAKALVATVDAKESMSRNHSETVGRYARQLALSLGNDEAFAEQMYLCGILHDVGKIGLSETIMNKPGRLTEAEFEQVQQHPELGAQIVSNAGLRDISLWVRHHHEHYDGSGYPAQLVGEAIPSRRAHHPGGRGFRRDDQRPRIPSRDVAGRCNPAAERSRWNNL